MAKVSSCILLIALENVARLLGDATPTVANYKGMGAGNSDTGAQNTDTDLIGAETHYDDVVPTYEADYKTVWVNTFLYADLASHIFKELVICESAALHASKSLTRMTYDPITLGEDETLTFTVKNACQQGT